MEASHRRPRGPRPVRHWQALLTALEQAGSTLGSYGSTIGTGVENAAGSTGSFLSGAGRALTGSAGYDPMGPNLPGAQFGDISGHVLNALLSSGIGGGGAHPLARRAVGSSVASGLGLPGSGGKGGLLEALLGPSGQSLSGSLFGNSLTGSLFGGYGGNYGPRPVVGSADITTGQPPPGILGTIGRI